MIHDSPNILNRHSSIMKLCLAQSIKSHLSLCQGLIDQLQVDVKHVRPSVEKTRPNTTKNPDVDRLEEDVNRLAKRWGNCCMQVQC